MRAPRCLTLFASLSALAVACSAPPVTPEAAPTPAAAPAPYQLPESNVIMEANPAPPFTYWAPEGATIRNHPNVPGIWNAFVEGKNIATYFGDECRASQYQRFVGQPLQSFPALPPDLELRASCDGCAVNDDLRRNRVNVSFSETTQVITRIACF